MTAGKNIIRIANAITTVKYHQPSFFLKTKNICPLSFLESTVQPMIPQFCLITDFIINIAIFNTKKQ